MKVKHSDSDKNIAGPESINDLKAIHSDKYPHIDIEKKWQKIWNECKLYLLNLDSTSKPYYNLMMFPYPSAEGLHVGNMYAFTGSDIYGRYKKMQGYDVFEPIGLDGFGIHSENFALKIGRHPMEHASITQHNYYKQLHQIGAMFEWSKTLETYDPNYYKWTQWLFIQMFKNGLAYRKGATVNYCPGCKTVLADEQVINAKCERCGKNIEKRTLEQWFIKITAYAEKLLENIPALNWSEKVKTAQTNWIGKKTGALIEYEVFDGDNYKIGKVQCFTTRPDTNHGATFVVLAPEHPFVTQLLQVIDSKHIAKISNYLKMVKNRTEEERLSEANSKTGVNTGLYCINKLTGLKLPLYISDFVIMGFGTGAAVGVPAHDERDNLFARIFKLPIRKVVDYDNELHVVASKESLSEGFKQDISDMKVYFEERDHEYVIVANNDVAQNLVQIISKYLKELHSYVQVDGKYKGIITRDGLLEEKGIIEDFLNNHNISLTKVWLFNIDNYPFCYTGEGVAVNSGILDGMTTQEASKNITEYIKSQGFGDAQVIYHLRDWLISRQRYWGPPIPMIFCPECKKNGLSWFRAKSESKYQSSMSSAKENIAHLNDPDLKREVSMAGWYPEDEVNLPVNLPRIDDYRPGDDGVAPLAKHKEFYEVKCPGCGGDAVRETDVSDTFLDSSWYFLRYPSVDKSKDFIKTSKFRNDNNLFPWDQELTKKWLPVDMYTGGAEHSVLHLLYSRFITMALKDFGYLNFEEPFRNFFAHGLVIKDGAKMSKSKGNVVNPDEYINTYGADALRMYLMFMGPFSQGGDFRDTAMEGMSRWTGRIWRMAKIVISSQFTVHSVNEKDSIAIKKQINKLIKKVGEDLEARRYNTAIASMMEFTNWVSDQSVTLPIEVLKKFLLILAPFAPFLTEELWQMIHGVSEPNYKAENSIHKMLWPEYDKNYVQEEEVLVVIQINGKSRAFITMKPEISVNKSEVESLARSNGQISKYLTSTEIKNIIFVPGKLMNFVTVPKIS